MPECKYLPREISQSKKHYEIFHGMIEGTATLDEVEKSSAGVLGWSDVEPGALCKVGDKVHSSGLCGL